MLQRPLIPLVVVILLVAPPLLAQEEEDNPSVDSKGRYVVYIASQDTDETFELYRSKLDTGTDLKLNGPLMNGGRIYLEAGFGDP